MDTLINGPFGSEVTPVSSVPVPDGASPPAPGSAQPDGPSVQVTDALLAQQPGFQEARAARLDSLYRPEASALESMGAAITQWDTSRLFRRIARPTFENDPPISQNEYLQHLPMVLTPDEREYFTDVATGQKAAEYALEQIQEQRQARRAMADHPGAALIAAFADPLWLAVPPAVRLGKLSPVAGRVVSAGAAAGFAGAVTALGEGPVSDEEIALSMVMNAAGGAAFYKPGQGLQKVLPDFPEQAANEVVQAAAENAAATAGQATKPRYRLVSPAQYEDRVVPATPPKFSYTKDVSKALDSADPRYAVGSTSVTTSFANPIDKAAYIVAGTGKSAKHAEILQWALRNSKATEAQLIARGTEIRNAAKAAVRAGGIMHYHVPSGELTHAPRVFSTQIAPGVPERVERVKTADAQYELLPPELQPGGNITHSPEQITQAATDLIEKDAKQRGVSRLAWNTHREMSSFGDVGKKVANIFYDNNADLSTHSVESYREASLSTLRTHQFEYEDQLRQMMAERGAGTWQQVVNPREAYKVQQGIELQVQRELFRREQAERIGAPLHAPSVDAKISALADKIDALHKTALREMQAAGVTGASELAERAGYYNRKWNSTKITQVIDDLETMGLRREAAHAKVTGLVSLALRRANGWDKQLADQVGSSIIDRALRKGYFEDGLFNMPAGEGQIKQMRDVLSSGGMSPKDIDRALDVMRLHSDEAGKAGYLKHRMDLDYKATMQVGDNNVSVMDLIDSNVSSIIDQYNMRVATNVAFARKGLTHPSDIEALRTELLHNTPRERREAAKELFDNTVAFYRGDPSGAKVAPWFHTMGAYGRSIALSLSGLWQATEFATALGLYGLRKSFKYAAAQIPGFKQLALSPTRQESRSLNNVLAEHSTMGLRLRPYIARYEDGYEMDVRSGINLATQRINQIVPYANGMRYIHHTQAKMVGNLITDRIEQAASGNAKAREALSKYGLGYQVMDKVAGEIQKHGLNVDAWDDRVWRDVQPAVTKMMDEAVLRGRLGDIPSFAAFDTVGKFLFTYRTFVLAAHNKLLVGGLERNGAASVGLILMYQLPLAMAAVQAQSVLYGAGPLPADKMLAAAVGQMGGIGLFSEPWKIATGQANSFGSPGLIPVDRAAQLLGATASGNATQAGGTALSMIPVISAIPFIKGVAQQVKDE